MSMIYVALGILRGFVAYLNFIPRHMKWVAVQRGTSYK